MYKIKEPISIPYGDQKDSFWETIKNGGKSRNLNPFLYGLKRILNYFIFITAYIIPFNKFRVTLNRWKGVNIGNNVYIGMFVSFDNAYPEFIYVEENASINAGTMIVAHFNPKSHFSDLITPMAEPVIIKEGAIVSVRSIILPGVTVGKRSIVSAGSVVNKSVPDYTLVMGNPAKKITTLKLP